MDDVFTRYIRALEPGEEAAPELLEAFWQELRALLRLELRRRNLWNAPPSYLGISARSWLDPDALDDLATDAYLDVLRHLSGLKAQLQNHDNIDGYAKLCIRHFVQKRQQSRDPVGYRVFEISQIAVRTLCGDGALHVLEGDLRIGNDSLLAFSESAGAGPAGEAALAELTGEWIDALLPDLVTAWRKKEPAGVLAERILLLGERGAQVFRFRDFVSVLKRQVRERWRAFEISPDLVRLLEPSHDFVERDRFESLLRCVEDLLEGFEGRSKTYDYLLRLWSFLRFLAVESDSGQMPPQREASRELGIPRERISGLLETLGDWVKRCLEGAAAPATA